MNFTPDIETISMDVPYFDDVVSKDGWEGHSTSKSLDSLKAEIMIVIARLGGTVISFQRGAFEIHEKARDGFQILYLIKNSNGDIFNGRFDIAALPVKRNHRLARSLGSRREKSLKMALYMLERALRGQWFLQQLSPGYSALMPWMLADENSTLSQKWLERSLTGDLLPAHENEFQNE